MRSLWIAMIVGYEQNGCFDGAIKLFRQMWLRSVKPYLVTLASVLATRTNLAALQWGKESHEGIIRSGFESNIFMQNALVDMYAKFGKLDCAFKEFEKMPEQNVVSCSAMIVGYAMHGCGNEALQLFKQMQSFGTMPDKVTFIGVLSACCHAGLVHDGWQYLDFMSQDYHFTPAVEHRCCMVDLLGPTGQLDEAHNFINKMAIEPNAAVSVSLLGVCRIHTNIELGEHVVVCLLELNPENSAHYVLLSNIYVTAGRWDDRAKVRKLMKDRKIRKDTRMQLD